MIIHIDGNLVGILTAAIGLASNVIALRIKPRPATQARQARPIRLKRRLV